MARLLAISAYRLTIKEEQNDGRSKHLYAAVAIQNILLVTSFCYPVSGSASIY